MIGPENPSHHVIGKQDRPEMWVLLRYIPRNVTEVHASWDSDRHTDSMSFDVFLWTCEIEVKILSFYSSGFSRLARSTVAVLNSLQNQPWCSSPTPGMRCMYFLWRSTCLPKMILHLGLPYNLCVTLNCVAMSAAPSVSPDYPGSGNDGLRPTRRP